MRYQSKNHKQRPSLFSQFLVILWFRTKLSIRDKKFFILGILLPMISIGASIILNNVLVFKPGSDFQKINNNLNNNNVFITPKTLNSQQETLINTMKLQYSLNYTYLDDDTDLPNYIENKSLSSLDYGISFIGTSNSINIYYNSSIESIPSFVHSFFISLFKINGINLQLNETITVLSSEVTFDAFYLLMPMILQYGFVFFIPYFAILIVTDRDKGYKNHLILNSLRTSVYWFGNLVFDYLIFLIPTIIGWILLYSFKIDGIYSDNSGKSFLLFITFGISAIPFGFVLQFIFDKEETANKWLYPFTSIVTSIPSALISVAFPTSTPLIVELLLSILPTFSFCNGLKALTYNNSSTVSYTILIQLLSGLIYLILIYFIDNYKKPKKNEIINDEDSESIINNQIIIEDNDVLNEKEKIKRLIRDGSNNNINYPKIVVDGIYKQFIQPKPTLDKPSIIERCSGGTKVTKKNSIIKKAVDGIWFSVEKNEIFGLLGPNGSGKSTCLNLLTGLLKADQGDGYLSGKSIDKDKDVFQSIGSCSQNDILFENLTIYEHLYLFSRLKSITNTKSELEDEIDFYINKFSIQSFKNKKSSDLSGGTKRKLSVACCLIGDPQVVLLDEPSTSLDPISRNELHSLIDELKVNKSIIMTTHSINEINQCCNRVAIMVDGKIRCIGTPNHLKHKYGSGYTIDIIPKNYLNNSYEIHNFMAQTFPNATRVERLGRFISYDLPSQNQQSLSTIFRILQSNKQRLEILDFSASSSSLEKVFLKFANLQEEINKQQTNNKSNINNNNDNTNNNQLIN
ncbi:hypothetical protein ACTFIZ_009907 [Dictyostelium cf. discoideum]